MDGAIGEPGQELNPAALPGRGAGGEAPTTPRQAATVILLRETARGPELLLVKRSESARFMGGVWVFPGGAVATRDGAHPHRAAAVRELREEAAIALDAGALVEFSRWITPAQVKVRFDTRFFLAELTDGQQPRVDGQECVDLGWFAPHEALAAHERGEIALVFPTIKHLQQLAQFASVAELLDHTRGRMVTAVEPRVVLEGEVARVVLPGEPGYE